MAACTYSRHRGESSGKVNVKVSGVLLVPRNPRRRFHPSGQQGKHVIDAASSRQNHVGKIRRGSAKVGGPSRFLVRIRRRNFVGQFARSGVIVALFVGTVLHLISKRRISFFLFSFFFLSPPPFRQRASSINLKLGSDPFNLLGRVRYVDQVEETNKLQAVTRVADGAINLPSSPQSGVVERLEHTVERPWIPRQRNLRMRSLGRRRVHRPRPLGQKVKSSHAAASSDPRSLYFAKSTKFTRKHGHNSTNSAVNRHRRASSIRPTLEKTLVSCRPRYSASFSIETATFL